MGVYYRCSQCESTLHLSPQSPGFGRTAISCFVCGGQARYLPGGPSPEARIVNAPEGQGGAEDWQAVARSGVAEPVPNPTVPVQTPEALLELDAEEAPTVPVQSLTEEDFLRLGLLPDDLESGPGIGGLASLGAGGDPSLGSIDEDVIPTRAVEGLADRDIVLLGEDPDDDLEEAIPTRAVAGLAGRPVKLLGDDPLVDEPDEDVIPTRAVAGLADREVVHHQKGLAAAGPDIEEEIPTRSVSGLADKQIASYAPELYGDAPVKLSDEPTSWDGSVPPASQASWDGGALVTERSSWDEGDLRPPTDASWDANASAGPPVERSSWESELKPASASGPGVALEHNPTMVAEPGLATSSFAAQAPSDGFGDISPSPQRGPTSGPSAGVGAHPSLFNVQGLDVRPSGSADQSSTAMRLFAGVLFVVVFVVIFGGLVAYKQPQLIDKLLGRAAPAESEEADPTEDEAPAEDPGEETSRYEAFGLKPLDQDAPLEVTVANIQLRVKGKEVTVRVEGELTWSGEEPLTSASLGGVVAVQLPDEVRETYPLSVEAIKPAVTKSRPWKVGDKRAFTLTSKAIPKASIDHEGREVFFAWITLKGEGGAVSYDAPIHSVDIKD
ncbi:MAG: hypothetical protein CMH57_15105 [Myxococcales bacterium]|nr:hypothetical protein [Myxococcales bacterium]